MSYKVYKLLINQHHFYIGSTKNAKARHHTHMCYLRKGNHVNKHMQKLFNENNDISIDMCILKEFDNKKEAFEFERTTLHEIGDDPLCLNIHSTSEQYTEEYKRKLAESKKGEKNPNWGKTFSAETKRKLSEAKKGIPKPKVDCPHCGKIGGVGIMHRYHFDNCKLKTNIDSSV